MASQFMLCSFKTCPWVQRAAIVLQAKQVPYDITYIDRDNRPDWFLADLAAFQGAGAADRRQGGAVRVERHRRVPGRDRGAAAASRGSDRAGAQPRVDRLRADLRQRDIEHDVFRFGGGVHRARGQAWPARSASSTRRSRSAATPARISTGRSSRWSTRPTRRSCSATPSWTGCSRSASIEKFPHLAAWRDALVAAPAVKASTVSNIEAVWQENLILRKRWLSKFVSESARRGAGRVATRHHHEKESGKVRTEAATNRGFGSSFSGSPACCSRPDSG